MSILGLGTIVSPCAIIPFFPNRLLPWWLALCWGLLTVIQMFLRVSVSARLWPTYTDFVSLSLRGVLRERLIKAQSLYTVSLNAWYITEPVLGFHRHDLVILTIIYSYILLVFTSYIFEHVLSGILFLLQKYKNKVLKPVARNNIFVLLTTFIMDLLPVVFLNSLQVTCVNGRFCVFVCGGGV